MRNMIWMIAILALFGCKTSKDEARLVWVKCFDDKYAAYYSAETKNEKKETLIELLEMLDRAEGEQLFPKSPGYLNGNRIFAHLRLCALAFEQGEVAAAMHHKERAAALALKLDMIVLGGIDLGGEDALPLIARHMRDLDESLSPGRK